MSIVALRPVLCDTARMSSTNTSFGANTIEVSHAELDGSLALVGGAEIATAMLLGVFGADEPPPIVKRALEAIAAREPIELTLRVGDETYRAVVR